jgi:pSer/pThr/pTyr-binding forkhead associated (FHA) protein
MTDRSRLRQFMVDAFNDDELADLIFDYFPNVRPLLSDEMPLSQQVRTLIDFADRHEQLEHLVVVLEKLRPDAYCDFFQTDLALPPEPEPAKRDPNKIFISYANSDADFATRLAADLRQRDFPVWMAPDSILPGEKWVAAIERGLRECGIFLLVISPAGVDSKWVSQETQVAIMLENEGKMRILPLRVQRAETPLLLSTRQHISFDVDYDRGLAGLLAALRPGAAAAPPAARPAGESSPIVAARPSSPAWPVLIIDWPDTPNQEVTLDKPAITVGRAPDNDIVLELPIVSSHHLRLETTEERGVPRVSVVDVGSRNGTFLSGRRLTPNTPQPLEPGDVVNVGDRVGRSISLILHPGANAPMPPVTGPRVDTTAVVPNWDDENEEGGITAGLPAALRRVPVWAYAVAAVALVALLALFALRGRGAGERPTTGQPTADAAAAAVVAEATATDVPADSPTTAPTDAGAALIAGAATDSPTGEPTVTTEPPTVAPTATTELPTTEPTAEPAATTEPPTAEPTATAEPAATSEPTAAPTETPAAQPVALPTELPNFTISRSTPLGFEALGEWLRDDRNSRGTGESAISDEQARSGQYALRLAYDFATSGDDYVIFTTPRAVPIANDRERRFFKVWVLGDGATLNLSALIQDNEGEMWKVFLGEISGTEWQQLDGFIGDTTWPSGVIAGSAGNGQVDFPVRLRGLHLDDATPSFTGAGAVFLDDITVE